MELAGIVRRFPPVGRLLTAPRFTFLKKDDSPDHGKVREYEGSGCSLEEAMKGAISWCIRQDILKDFLERNASEVMNMLMSEWNWDDAFAVQREEGREESQQEIARKALAEGLSPELVQKITGLDLETIGRLSVQ